MSSQDKTLISDLMESFVSEVPAKPFVSFCAFCNKGVISEEMVYQKGRVFHKDCYDKHGSSYPHVNQELQSESSNARVQLIQLKNLKVRMGGLSSSEKTKPKQKKKSKHKTKRRTKRHVTKRKRIAVKRKTTRKKPSKKRKSIKRRAPPKRKKTKRRIKRRMPRRNKRKARRRR